MKYNTGPCRVIGNEPANVGDPAATLAARSAAMKLFPVLGGPTSMAAPSSGSSPSTKYRSGESESVTNFGSISAMDGPTTNANAACRSKVRVSGSNASQRGSFRS